MSGSAGTAGRHAGRPACAARARRRPRRASASRRVSRTRRRSGSATSARRSHGESCSQPERLGHPHVPDPGDEALVHERLAERAGAVGARAGGRASRRGRAASRGCPGRARRGRGCGARARGRPRGRPRAPAPRRISHGLPRSAAPRGCRTQRPLIRRCERSTMPPSKRRIRFLPIASTDSSFRPSSRSATRSAWARGCGDDASTRLADERLKPRRRAVERVALRHGRRRGAPGGARTT